MTHPPPQTLDLIAADGTRLAGTLYAAHAPVRGGLIVAGATGVPQGFYRRFALHASQRGFQTLTFDYRGIGRSRPSSLRGFRMNLLDWGRQDLAAAVARMKTAGQPLYMVGHSYGGHGFGLLPNHADVARFYTFATGAGWHGWMPRAERLRVLLMWYLVLPAFNRWKGYSPWSLLGLGEDLPLDVFRQWRYWCRFPHYFFDDPAMAGLQAQFAGVTTPIVAANALDDRWAPPRSRDAFMRGYRNAPVHCIDIPAAGATEPIGHMGYFRPAAQALWDHALDWLEQGVLGPLPV